MYNYCRTNEWVDSITKFGNELLQGTANLEDSGMTNLQKQYFSEKKIRNINITDFIHYLYQRHDRWI